MAEAGGEGVGGDVGSRPLATSSMAFVTAFQDRNAAAFKRAIANLAWGSFAWCVNEPEHLIALDGTVPGGVWLLSDFGSLPVSVLSSDEQR